jgi:tRNA (mo5U34)-methyltransferase
VADSPKKPGILRRLRTRNTAPPTQDPDPEAVALQAAVATVPDWFHSIDLGHGVVTPGNKSPETLAKELANMHLPDLHGRSVLDVGAWDGYFSFAAESLGADRVVSLDHYSWSLDLPAVHAYVIRCEQEGIDPEPWERVPEVWRPDTLPGRRGFDLARETLHSKVEPVVADFMTVDLDTLGTFDVTFFLGVLYHLENPFEAIRRLAAVTRELAVIETLVMIVVALGDHPLWQYFPGDEMLGDPSNWWAPNRAGLVGMCKAAGFSRVDVLDHPNDDLPQHDIFHGRTTIHAWK